MPKPRPRNTVRFRLTLLYGGQFVLSGACLLTITYLLVRAAGGVVVAITHYETGVPVGSGSIQPPPPLSSASGYASAQGGRTAPASRLLGDRARHHGSRVGRARLACRRARSATAADNHHLR
jgi:hypothetical protein